MLVASSAIKRFVISDSFPGVLVMIAVVFAMIVDNSSLSRYYHTLLNVPVGGYLGSIALKNRCYFGLMMV